AFQIAIAPGLSVIDFIVGDVGNSAREVDIGTRAIETNTLIPCIERSAQTGAAIIQTDCSCHGAHVGITDFGFAITIGGVYANAPLVVIAPTPANVDTAAGLTPTGVVKGSAGKRLIGCALRLNVDDTAQPATTGRGAVQERTGTFENLDPFHHCGGQHLPRQDAV